MKEEVNKGQGFKYRGNNIPVFAGNFDGNNKTIRNLYISGVGYDGYAGLFEKVLNVTNPVYIKNINIENVNIEKMKDYIGGLIGSIEANTKIDISNVSVSGAIKAGADFGGVIGKSSSTDGSTFNNIIFNGKIKCGGQRCGGILGTQVKTTLDGNNPIIVSNVKSIANVICYGGGCGIVLGSINGIALENIYAYGRISNIELDTGNGQGHFGAISGFISIYEGTKIENIYNYADIELNKSVGDIGGLFGQLMTYTPYSEPIIKAKMTNAYNYGNLNVTNTLGRVAGIAGNLYRIECTNCFNYGNINSEVKAITINGIVGQGSDNELINCTNFGTINMPE